MFILRTRLFIFSLGVATIVTGQPVQENKTGLRYGRFNIGFQHRILFDKTRSFEYTPGDSSVKSISALGRPLLLSFFSPTNERNQKNRLKIKDLFLFNAEKPIQKFIDRFTSYQLLQSKRYAIQENLPLEDFAGDPIRYEQLVDLLFDKHLNTQLRCFTVSEKPGAQYPVVIYHQGLGGTLDENSILLEFLASHGFVVVTSSFISGYGESTIGVGDTDASMKDLDFIIDYLKKQKIGDTDNIFLMGHSFGANTLLAYPQVGTHPVAGIIPIDSDYGYHLRFMMPQKMQPDLITQANYVRTRILAIGRPNATFRMIDLLDKTERQFLHVSKLSHNDFCAQTIVGLNYCIPFLKDSIEKSTVVQTHFLTYPVILNFLKHAAIEPRFIDSDKLRSTCIMPGNRLAVNQPLGRGSGVCPSSSQLVDYIRKEGMSAAGIEWKECADIQDTTVFNTEWLTVFDALLADSATETPIAFLRWFLTNRSGNHKMGAFLYYMMNACFVDFGGGFHYRQATIITNALAALIPDDLAVLKASVLCYYIEKLEATSDEKKRLHEELIKQCKRLLERYPSYWEMPKENSWDEIIYDIVRVFVR